VFSRTDGLPELSPAHDETSAALAAGAASGAYECACGFTCSCRDAEPSLSEHVPYARWLVGEAPADVEAPSADWFRLVLAIDNETLAAELRRM
jgi:hypothetical protein